MNEKMRVNLEELLPIIEEQLKDGKEICFSPNGVSMLPLLRPGHDSVILKTAPPRLKKYDLPLYRRKNGQFVLHRVIKVEKDNTYTMCGDNQFVREHGIKHSQIVGIVTSICRNDKLIPCRSPLLYLYAFLRVKERWIWGVFVRIKRKIFLKKDQDI